MPPAVPIRKLDQFQRVAVRIAELEGGGAARALRQVLRPGAADRRGAERRQPGERGGHVRHRHGEMLEHLVAGNRTGRIALPLRPERLQDQRLPAPAQHDLPHPRGAEQGRHVRGHVGPALGDEAERLDVEVFGPRQLRHRQLDPQQPERLHGRCAPRTLV